jgi:hypothetical protein
MGLDEPADVFAQELRKRYIDSQHAFSPVDRIQARRAALHQSPPIFRACGIGGPNEILDAVGESLGAIVVVIVRGNQGGQAACDRNTAQQDDKQSARHRIKVSAYDCHIASTG